MNYQYLDMEIYKRKDHFAYFNSLAYPYVGVTVNVNITNMLKRVREEKLPFFLTACYCAAKAANQIPEFRQRIDGGRVVEFAGCKTSHTVALEDGTYCYCTLDSDMPFRDYIPYAVQTQEEAKQRHTIEEERTDSLDKFFISTLPWISYTAFVQPVPIPADSNPRLTWGKYISQGGEYLLPVSVLCHHALVDGIHIGRFYQLLDEQIAAL